MVSIFLFTPGRSDIPGQGNRGGGKEKKPGHGKPPHIRVRTKTFSAHVALKIHHDVRKSGVFTHEKVRPETSHAFGRTDKSIYNLRNLNCQVTPQPQL